MSPLYCQGKMYNGPEKHYTRCNICGDVDYEKNEGDICNVIIDTAWLNRKARRALNRMMQATVNIENKNYEDIVGLLDEVASNVKILLVVLDDPEFYKE